MDKHVIVITGAGSGLGASFARKYPLARMLFMIDINLKGTIFCTQAVLPDMKKEK